ncbi:MAG: Ig-like domain-containing protein [Vicinamibacterales bacterium]
MSGTEPWMPALLSHVAAQSSPTYVFGPVDFVRPTTRAFEVERMFRVASPSGTYTLCVDNAGVTDQFGAVTSAEIELNSKYVATQTDFRSRPAAVRKTVQLKKGSNELEVEIESAVGSGFSVSIVQGGSANCPGGTQANRVPTITSTAIATGLAGQAYSYDVNATDPDNDTLAYSLTTFPTGMTVAPTTGLIAWTPTSAGTFPVVAQVSDGRGGVATQSFSIAVTQPNRAPSITSNPGATPTVVANQLFSYDVDAIDPDGDTLLFSLSTSPTGMSIVGVSGIIAWVPDTAGTYPVTVQVSDGRGGLVAQSFSLVVTPAPVNHAPTATDDHYAVQAGRTLTIPARGVLQNDADPDGQALSAQGLTTPDKGTLSGPNPDGSFSYTAPAGPSGSPFQTALRNRINLNTASVTPALGGHYEVDVNGDGVRDIVTHGYNNFAAYDGPTGSQLWLVSGGFGGVLPPPFTQPCRFAGYATGWAVGDIDDDGEPEIVTPANCDSSVYDYADFLMALDARTGAQKWLSPRLAFDKGSLPGDLGGIPGAAHQAGLSIARLAPGAAPSIVFGVTSNNCNRYVEGAPAASCRRVTIVDGPTGSTRRSMTAFGAGVRNRLFGDITEEQTSPVPIVFDLDGDGTVEIVYAGVVFTPDGEPKWELPVGVPHVAIGNLDDTPDAEVIVVTKNYESNRLGNIEAYKADGTMMWRYPLGNGDTNVFGHLTVADVDGDGFADILFPYFDYGLGSNMLLALGNQGQLKWLAATESGDGLHTNSSRVAVFDLDADGIPEVIKQDRNSLNILDGLDGSVKAAVPFGGPAATSTHTVSVADLNGDGRAEIVAVHFGLSGPSGIWVLTSAGNDWRRAAGGLEQFASGGATADENGSLPFSNNNPFADRRTNVWGTVAAAPLPPSANLRNQTSFQYFASDGSLVSPAARVTIDIAPPNRPPVFTSSAPSFFTPNVPFSYAAFAVDPDAGDTVTYHIAAIGDEYGMTAGSCGINSASGLLNCGVIFFNANNHSGKVQLVIVATDTHGASASQTVSLLPISGALLVPNVLGQQQAAATSAIVSAGLQLGGVVPIASGAPAGQIISQSPVAGTPLQQGGYVVVVVSAGPPPVTVPNLVGQAEAVANSILLGNKLSVGTPTYVISSSVPDGRTVGQTPAAGTTASRGAAVALVVSLGSGVRVSLARPLVTAGTAVAFTGRVLTNGGSEVLPTPALTFEIQGAPSAGAPPTVSGGTIVTATDTRGVFTLRATLASSGAFAETPFVVGPGAASAIDARMSAFSETLASTGRQFEQISQLLRANDLLAIPPLAEALRSTRASLDLESLSRTPVIAFEEGFLPSPAELTAAGFAEAPSDAVWRTRLGAVIDLVRRTQDVLASDSPARDELSELQVLVGQLQSAIELWQDVPVSPNGFVSAVNEQQLLIAVEIPRLLAAAIDRGVMLLQQQGLSASLNVPRSILANRSPAAFYGSADNTFWTPSSGPTLVICTAIAAIVAKVGIPMIVNGMENRAAVRAVAGFRNTLKTQTSRQVLEVDTGFGPSGGYLGTVQKLTFAGGTAAIRSSVYGASPATTDVLLIGQAAIPAAQVQLNAGLPSVANPAALAALLDQVRATATSTGALLAIHPDELSANGRCVEGSESSPFCYTLTFSAGIPRPSSGPQPAGEAVLIIINNPADGSVIAMDAFQFSR